MAKNKKEEVAIEELPVVEGQVIENVAQPIKVKPVKKDDWEIKDRTYILKGDKEPLTFTIPSKHTRRHPLLWFDQSAKEQRELRYATNMNSPFVDEQKGEVTMGHITFRDGSLHVASKDVALQKLLSLYHPMKDRKYAEYVPKQIASDELVDLEYEIEALLAARMMDVDEAEAIVRVEQGNVVDSLSSKEVKRDLMLLAKRNPKLFLSLAADENVGLRNAGIKAESQGLIRLSQDQRTFHWGSNDRKLMTVPFDENPYTALAAWFKTDDGVEVYKSVEKQLQ
jgi:hypothetical protein|tara:strand:- start:423 stop:1268 length:846 start_codon:yes stop_codon:yes gene_type:complete